MRARLEEEPEPDEDPDEEPETAPAAAPMVPAVSMADREYEYEVEVITAAEVTDGQTLPEKLNRRSTDGWNLVDIVAAGDSHAVLFRRAKKTEKENRRVGFAPPGLH